MPGLMIINLCCSTVMALCGWWMLTDRSMPLLIRLFCSLIATGGSVNVLGMTAALVHLGGFVYGDIWPGEVVVNVGVSLLMMRWTWRLSHSNKHGSDSGTASSGQPS